MNFEPALIIPILIFMIPIISILTAHQRKMAELVGMAQHPNTDGLMTSEDARAIRDEIRQLRSIVTDQSIAIDNIRYERKASTNVSERLSQDA